MMAKGNIYTYKLSDLALLEQIGKHLKSRRLTANLTQERLAKDTGVDRTTIVQIENGRSVSLLIFIQVLRGLNMLEIFNLLEETNMVSPIETARSQAKVRKRAGKSPDTGKTASTW